MRTLLIAAFLLLGNLNMAHGASAVPKDVSSFISKRDGCDHFRGELPDPSEKKRMKEVIRKINTLCKGTDEALAALKKKYANNAKVMSLLNEYEEEIEGHPVQ